MWVDRYADRHRHRHSDCNTLHPPRGKAIMHIYAWSYYHSGFNEKQYTMPKVQHQQMVKEFGRRNASLEAPQTSPFLCRSRPSTSTRFLGPTWVHNPNGIRPVQPFLYGTRPCADRQTYITSVATGCISALCVHVMRPNNDKLNNCWITQQAKRQTNVKINLMVRTWGD